MKIILTFGFTLFFALITLAAPTFHGHWKLNRVECASGDEPQYDWSAWDYNFFLNKDSTFRFDLKPVAIHLRSTGKFLVSEMTKLCLIYDTDEDQRPQCTDFYFAENDLRLGSEVHDDESECASGDYKILYFKLAE